MAYFAKIDILGNVEEIIVINDSESMTKTGKQSEKIGKSFIKSLGIEGDWIMTSEDGSRGKYAAIGDTYDSVNDIFVSPSIKID
jgi:hypothetical protein